MEVSLKVGLTTLSCWEVAIHTPWLISGRKWGLSWWWIHSMVTRSRECWPSPSAAMETSKNLHVRHRGLVVSAPTWDGTGCELDSRQCRIYILCSLSLRLLGPLRVHWVHMAWHKNCVKKKKRKKKQHLQNINIEDIIEHTFLPTSSCEDMRSSSSDCCCCFDFSSSS